MLALCVNMKQDTNTLKSIHMDTHDSVLIRREAGTPATRRLTGGKLHFIEGFVFWHSSNELRL